MRWELVRSVRFRWLLPLLALVVWAVVIVLPAVQTYWGLRAIGVRGKNAGGDGGDVSGDDSARRISGRLPRMRRW